MLVTLGILTVAQVTSVRPVFANLVTVFSAGAFLFHNQAAMPSVVNNGVSSTGNYHDGVGAGKTTRVCR